MNRIRHWAAAVAAALSLDAGAGAYTDLWWNPQESGWGASIVQQDETAFVTLFVYAPDGRPTWYVAPSAEVFGYVGAYPNFSGTLYKTRGPWMGGPFDPNAVEVTPVGQVWLEPLAKDRIRLTYGAEGVTVVKEVVRQTWRTPSVAANYTATFNLRQAFPGAPPWGARQYSAEILAHVEGGEGFLRVSEVGSHCDYRGAFTATGSIGKIAGDFSCTGGETGTFEITDFEVTQHGVSGYLRTWSAELNQYGRFGAARY